MASATAAPLSTRREILIRSSPTAIRPVQEHLLSLAASFGFDPRDLFAIRLAVEEALSNAICHGNGNCRDKLVRVRFEVDASQAVIEIEDEGPGFDPADVPDCTSEENLTQPCGRGILLMQWYMSSVSYNQRGNCVRLVRRRWNAAASLDE